MEMENYYKILGLGYKFSSFELFKSYLRESKKALSSINQNDFIKVHQAYEVLRNERTAVRYNKIFKKFILNQDQNFPKYSEDRLVNELRQREKTAFNFSKDLLNRGTTFNQHLLGIIVNIAIDDLLCILTYGLSGILCISIGLYCFAFFNNNENIIGGIILIVLGLFLFKRNVSNYITN